MPSRAIYGLPQRPRPLSSYGIEPRFPWDHDLPGRTSGGIYYVPSLGLMSVVDTSGVIQYRDPVTTKIVFANVFTLSTDGVIAPCYVPSCNKIVVPAYGNSGFNFIIIHDLEKDTSKFLGSLTTGLYQAAYCPVNDRVYITGFGGQLVYVLDAWAESIEATITTGIGALTIGIAFCPLNGKIYCLSRTANNAQRINPATNAVDSTFTTGGAYDEIFYSDAMQKMVITAASSAVNWKTIDPLNSDAVASLGFGGIAFSGTYIPATGETFVVDNGGNALRFISQSGTNTASITVTGEALLYCGYNPITKTVWVVDGNNRKLWVIDPFDRVVLERLAMVKQLG